MGKNTEMTLIEAIRRRPAMYIGSTSVRGFIWLVRSIISRIFAETGADHFSLELLEDLRGKIVIKNIQNPIYDNAVTNPFWNEEVEQLYPLELPSLNALSDNLEFSLFDKNNTQLVKQIYKKGVLKTGEIRNLKYSAERLEMSFELDNSIFEISDELNESFFIDEVRNFAYLYKGKTLEFKYKFENEPCKVIYKFENGLKDKIDVEKLKGHGNTYFDTHIDTQIDDFFVEVAFGFREISVDEPFLISYTNDHHTHENGTHVDGLLKGLTYGVMKYFQKHELTQKYKISEKGMKENLVAAIHVKMKQPHFSGCVKNKLASPEIIEPIANCIAELLFQKIENDEESTQRLIRKFEI